MMAIWQILHGVLQCSLIHIYSTEAWSDIEEKQILKSLVRLQKAMTSFEKNTVMPIKNINMQIILV